MRTLFLLGLLLIQEPDIDSLLKQLTDESIEVREKAAAALVTMAEKSVSKLKLRISTAEGELKARREQVLRKIEREARLREVIPPIKRISIEAKPRPLSRILAEFRAKTGLRLEGPDGWDPEIAAGVSDAPVLEALETLIRSTGFAYRFDQPFVNEMGGTLPPDQPAKISCSKPPAGPSPVFVRHYRVRTTDVSIYRNSFPGGTNRGMHLRFGIQWSPEVRPDRIADFEILEAVDERGRTLIPSGGFKGRYSQSLEARPLAEHVNQVTLTHPEADSRKIASLKGRFVMQYRFAERVLTFEKPAEGIGQEREHDGLKIQLRRFRVEAGDAMVEFAITGRRQSPPKREFPRPWKGPIAIETGIRLVIADGSKVLAKGWDMEATKPLGTFSWFTGLERPAWRPCWSMRSRPSLTTSSNSS